jgi:MFS transporter, DHA2 family, multidrug resistance protein
MSETGARKTIITITVILASLLELVDTTVVNVSLPQIMGNLGATLEDVSWVVTAYSIANVIIIPMTPWLSAKFGRRNYYLFSIILFTIASFFCGNANSIWELVAFRFIQGIGGGGLLSTSQAILLETYKKEERGMATAMFGLGVVVGPTFGPTLGGYITDHFNWPWVFYINLPLGTIATLLAMNFIREPKYKQILGDNDWLGILLLITGIGSLQTVLERGQTEDWFDTPYITVLTIVAILSLVGFVWRELTAEHPVVNLRLMGNRSLAFGMFLTFVLGFGLFGSVFIFPIFCQNLLGFTAQQTGMLLIPGGLTTIAMMPIVGTMLRKGASAKMLAAFGFSITAVYCYVSSKFNLSSGPGDFLAPLVIRGIGLSMLFVPITTVSLGSLEPRDIPQGSGLNNMMRQLGGSFGIALINTFIAHRAAYHRVMLLSNINQYNPAFTARYNSYVQGMVAKTGNLYTAKQLAYKIIDLNVYKQTTLLSYMDVYLLIAFFFVICVPLLFLTRSKKGAVMADAH